MVAAVCLILGEFLGFWGRIVVVILKVGTQQELKPVNF